MRIHAVGEGTPCEFQISEIAPARLGQMLGKPLQSVHFTFSWETASIQLVSVRTVSFVFYDSAPISSLG
jgi:hypothetical protein